MLIFFGILIVVACVLLGFFVLVQNPKGGGLSGSFGGFGNQVMGVRQTTDVLEKGTWILAAAIAILCLTSAMFVNKGAGSVQKGQSVTEQTGGAPAPASAPAKLPTPQQQQPK
ncbi:preprotein translocase subunit SecG [Chitinophaga sp. SYP-B3965]|uniref:preprotein translocase subunit SecG n=1 Tax=Chitinophaga sp. SYP-B3965 TaxID=2663120 RepID=UPI00129998AC|nr:preprotein translocase subunit SecG [Chitinophaga sp. SYP-B3965]MRG43657.1 preprotein translocase subunit SecG [Chitinophaga sp. SYP-B3965]